MVHQRIREVFEKYTQLASPRNFGFRNAFLDPALELQPTGKEGGEIAVYSPSVVKSLDCGRTAFRVGQELDREFPIRYKYAVKNTPPIHTIQNYVEVQDPQEGWVQVDATPYHQRINPGHTEAGEHTNPREEDYSKAVINARKGVLLSVEKQDSCMVDTHVFGSYYSTHHKGIAGYMFRLFSRSFDSANERMIDCIRVSVTLPPPSGIGTLAGSIGNGPTVRPEAIDQLARSGAVGLLIEGQSDLMHNLYASSVASRFSFSMSPPQVGGESLEYLDTIKSKPDVTPGLASQAERNLDVLVHLLLKASSMAKAEGVA